MQTSTIKNCAKMGVAVALVGGLSACAVAPAGPIGVRQTSAVLPTYVNGQYIGMQPSNYVPPATQPVAQPQVASVAAPTAAATAATAAAPVAPAPAVAPPAPAPAPTYLQATNPSVVYVQAPPAVYTYSYPYPYYWGPYPYYSPMYVGPWFGGIGFGLGVRIHIH